MSSGTRDWRMPHGEREGGGRGEGGGGRYWLLVEVTCAIYTYMYMCTLGDVLSGVSHWVMSCLVSHIG